MRDPLWLEVVITTSERGGNNPTAVAGTLPCATADERSAASRRLPRQMRARRRPRGTPSAAPGSRGLPAVATRRPYRAPPHRVHARDRLRPPFGLLLSAPHCRTRNCCFAESWCSTPYLAEANALIFAEFLFSSSPSAP